MKIELRKIIYSDLYRYVGEVNTKKLITQFFTNDAFRYTILFRKNQYHFKKNNKIRLIIYRYLLLKSSKKYGYQIQYNTTIGEGLYLGHRGTIIINGQSKLGDNINLGVGVTIGQENRGKRIGCPTIGNKVWIGSNSIVVGNIKIGNNVLIAPLSYVNMDIPSNSIVIGNPARIIQNKPNATESYVHNIYSDGDKK